MEYLLSLLLLALNLVDYEHNINRIVFFAVGLVLFCALFYVAFKKTKDYFATCLILFCHTWQISWINVFGDPVSELQLPWFYLTGVLVALYVLMHLGTAVKSKHNGILLATFAAFLIISVYPLLSSASKSEGLKEYVMIGFFAILVFCAFLFFGAVGNENRIRIENAFLFAVLVSCGMIVFQTVFFRITGMTLFKFTIGQYYGGVMTVANLLMEDTSCSTIMLGCGAFILMQRFSKKNWYLCVAGLLLIAAALSFTTRRTSIISLIAVLFLYILFHYKGAVKKTVMFALLLALAGLMVFYLTVSRPVDNLSQYLDPNGRFENYSLALDVFIHNLFGVGYDNMHLAALTGGIIPHNTLLRWLCMGGVWFAVPLIIIIGYSLYYAGKKKQYAVYWMLIYSVVASNFIPDILNARFLVIPCMAAFLLASHGDGDENGASVDTDTDTKARLG